MKVKIKYISGSKKNSTKAIIVEDISKDYLFKKYNLKLNDKMYINLLKKYSSNIGILNLKDNSAKITFSSMSYCNENDPYNKNFGKKLARMRVMPKYLRYIKYLLKLRENNNHYSIKLINKSIEYLDDYNISMQGRFQG